MIRMRLYKLRCFQFHFFRPWERIISVDLNRLSEIMVCRCNEEVEDIDVLKSSITIIIQVSNRPPEC